MWRTGPRSRRLSIPLTLILALATVISMWPAAAVATPAVRVTSIGVKTYPGVVQVAISGSGPLRFRATTMSNPFRVLIDIPGALLAGPVPAVLNVAQPPVLRVRAGQFQQSTVRVVIDLAAPTAYQVSAVTPSVLAARLTVPQTAAKVTKPAVAVAAAPPPAAPAVARAGTPVAQAPPAPATAGRITIDLRNAELSDVLSALAKLCGFNIVTDSSVKGQITVRLADVTCEEALRFILDANNLGLRRLGNNLIVMAADKLAALDIQIPQIMIETRVVDINTEVLKDLGLTWGSVDGLVGFPITITSITAPGPIPATLTVMTSSAAFQFFLTALVKNDKARVLSAPRVAVVDGNKATINLGQEVPIPQRDANGNVTLTFKPVGVNLEITPRLNRDGNITTQINSEVSSIRGFTTTEVPFLNTRKASTTVTVKNGESIIIGGMISAEERETTIKVPLLGDIPIIGA